MREREREKERALLLGEKESVFRSVCVVLLANCVPLI